MVTVRAPATTANLGSGFDVFGAALERPADIVTVEKAARTSVEVTGIGSQYIPEDPAKNTVGAVAEALDAPAHIKIDKGVRPSSGLGSSAASAAGAAVALNELYDRGHSRRELVPLAAKGETVAAGEAHQDNVAPAILGGFTVVADDRLTQVDSSVPLVACLPERVVSTRDARAVVPKTAELGELVETVGNASTLVAGMFRDDPELVGAGMADPVVTPARTPLIDGYDRVESEVVEAGATGVTVSGAGPTVIAACYPEDRTAVASAMVDAFRREGVESRAYPTRVASGATIID